jgi:hypothetical protein
MVDPAFGNSGSSEKHAETENDGEQLEQLIGSLQTNKASFFVKRDRDFEGLFLILFYSLKVILVPPHIL